MNNRTLHFAMLDQRDVTLDFDVHQLVIVNNTPAFVYIRVAGSGIPGATDAEIAVSPWEHTARGIVQNGVRTFAINVLSDTNPFPAVTPDLVITFNEVQSSVAFSTATPSNNPSPTVNVNHPLLDASVDSDTIAHSPVQGDVIFANGSTPSKWDAIAAPTVASDREVLTANGIFPAVNLLWSISAKARLEQGGTQGIAAGAAAINFNTVAFDTDTMFDIATPSRLSNINRNAYYLVGASYRFNNATASDLTSYSYFQKGGVGTLYGIQNADMNAASQRRHMASALIHMNSGEYVEFWIQNNSGASVTVAVAEFWAVELF